MPKNNQWDFTDDSDDDDEGQDQQQQGKGLRAQLEAALKENKTLKASNDKLTAQIRQVTVSGLLDKKGVSPKVAKLLPLDVEPTEEAITKWLEEFGDVFTPVKVEMPETDDVVTDDSDDANADVADQMSRLAGATGAAKPPSKDADLMKKLKDPALTQEGLLELIASSGGGYGTG